MHTALRARLRHVYWVGGGSGAGKSTIARRLAARHGLRVYATDEVMSEHAERSTPRDAPLLREFLAMDMDERWMNRGVRVAGGVAASLASGETVLAVPRIRV